MKFNFKKIGSVIASAAMIGATAGFAAAATNYPAPFSDAGDYSIVIGSDLDMSAATTIGSNLMDDDTTTGTVTGEKVKIALNSDSLNLGDGLEDLWGTSVMEDDLPDVLAEGTFVNAKGSTYEYKQRFDIANLTFSHFADSQYENKKPTLGFEIGASDIIGNYTLDFKSNPQADHGTDLDDFENREITILGKNYYILDFKNSTAEITLLDSAVSTKLGEGESKVIEDNAGNSYKVAVDFVGEDNVIFSVDDIELEKMSDDGEDNPNTLTLSNDAYIGVKEINYHPWEGGLKTVSFSIGQGKLNIKDGSYVKINDQTVSDLTAHITMGDSGSKRTWEKLVLEWKSGSKDFLTEGKELVMPGFSSIKYLMEGVTKETEEKTLVDYSGGEVIELETTITDGAINLPLVWISATTGNITGIGGSADERLATSNSSSLTFNATPGDNQYSGFVVSWANSKESETYFLSASVEQDYDDVENYTTITNEVTDEVIAEYVTEGSIVNVGRNIRLTINDANRTDGSDHLVYMSVNDGGSFHELYTAEGLKIYLPFENPVGEGDEKGEINLTGESNTGNTGEMWTLWMAEEDRDGTLGANYFSLNITDSSEKVTVNAIGGAGTSSEIESSDVFESYVSSDLATKIHWDKSNSDQYSAEVTYHGSEMYANLYVAESGSSLEGSDANVVVLMDDEITEAQKTNNLIVVGGSAVNSIAAKLLFDDETMMKYGADFTSATTVGPGGYLVKTYANPYAADKVATLVAGYEQADTVSAANALIGGLSTDVGAETIAP